MPNFDVQLGIVGGTARFLASTGMPNYGPYHEQLAISPDEWSVLTSDSLWMRAEKNIARTALEKFVNGALGLADLPIDHICAEFAAAIINCVVQPCNWRVACGIFQTFSGERLVAATGDAVAAREKVAPDRLFTMTLAMADDPNFAVRTEAVRAKVSEAAAKKEAKDGKA